MHADPIAPLMPLSKRVVAERSAEIRRLAAEGSRSKRSIAREVGVAEVTVWAVLNPAKARQSAQRTEARRLEAQKALRARERDREIRRAVRKAGAALAESYSLACRMRDVIAQAETEQAGNAEALAALADARAAHHQTIDAIVRALGVGS